MKLTISVIAAMIMAIANSLPTGDPSESQNEDQQLLQSIGRLFFALGRSSDGLLVKTLTGQNLPTGSYSVNTTNATGVNYIIDAVLNDYLKVGKATDITVANVTGLNTNGTNSTLTENDRRGLPAIFDALVATIKAAFDVVLQPSDNTTSLQSGNANGTAT